MNSSNGYYFVAEPTSALRQRGLWIAAAVAAAVVIALTAGFIGKAIGSSDGPSPPVAAPETVTDTVTVTETLQPPPPTIGAPADPVCAQWAPIADEYRVKQSSWVEFDPEVPASEWSDEQRDASTKIVPVLRAEVSDLPLILRSAPSFRAGV